MSKRHSPDNFDVEEQPPLKAFCTFTFGSEGETYWDDGVDDAELMLIVSTLESLKLSDVQDMELTY